MQHYFGVLGGSFLYVQNSISLYRGMPLRYTGVIFWNILTLWYHPVGNFDPILAHILVLLSNQWFPCYYLNGGCGKGMPLSYSFTNSSHIMTLLVSSFSQFFTCFSKFYLISVHSAVVM